VTAIIEARALTKRFGGRRGILDVEFDVAAGEVFGFLGPNGAGKSTTIRLMLGLYRPTAGRVAVLGHDPIADPVTVHAGVGYLPGELALFPRLTGQEHIDRFAHARGMTDFGYRDELIERFGVELDRPVHTLSKGNRQKVGIVLAFMHRPELLVLDEPTSGLDPLLQDEFDRLLRETAAAGRTVFLSSHELDEVQRAADRVAIIKEGRIVVVDSVESLRRSAPRTVEFRFDRPVDARAFNGIDGVTLLASEDGIVRLSLSGPVGPLLRVAANLDPVDMTARAADLDELFLTYYRDEVPTQAQRPEVAR
jgi:beta-exotoxin I transport system ATP-binding protein